MYTKWIFTYVVSVNRKLYIFASLSFTRKYDGHGAFDIVSKVIIILWDLWVAISNFHGDKIMFIHGIKYRDQGQHKNYNKIKFRDEICSIQKTYNNKINFNTAGRWTANGRWADSRVSKPISLKANVLCFQWLAEVNLWK